MSNASEYINWLTLSSLKMNFHKGKILQKVNFDLILIILGMPTPSGYINELTLNFPKTNFPNDENSPKGKLGLNIG